MAVEPPPGIIAWWPFDEASGTIAEDIAGDNPGMHVDGPVSSPGLVDRALHFDGSNDYVAVPDSDLWTFGSNDFTIELWANFDTQGGGTIGHPGDIFIGCDEGGGPSNKWFFALGGGYLNFAINGPGIGQKFFPRALFSPTVGQWYHLGVTRKGNIYTLFIDGTPVKSEVNNDVIPNPDAPLTIGQAEGIGFMNGYLDEVTIYNRALAEEEIRTIAEAGAEGKGKKMDLPAGWSMISLPVTPAVSTLTTLFPDAVVVYKYIKGTGYVWVQAGENLEVGVGYWILLEQPQSYVIKGTEITKYMIPVVDGWYMIGGCSMPADKMVTSGKIVVVYGYTQGVGYERIPDSKPLEPGKGYWIFFSKTSEGAEFTAMTTVSE
jgi:hypothetical protein